MNYKNNNFFVGKVSAGYIAKKFGTPVYVYSSDQIKKNIFNFKKSFNSFKPLICFSVKSNSNINIIKIIKNEGLGADVVSMGELLCALKAGINPKKIVFSGVGKTINELNYAISKKILLINAESENEIFEIEKIAKKKKILVKIGLRLNPDTDARTLSKISTGKSDDKFGVSQKIFKKIIGNFRNSKYIKIICLSVHIGSQITSNEPYEKMLSVIQKTIKSCNYKFEYLDLGGGMGIKYDSGEKKLNLKRYSIKIKKFLKKINLRIIFEPGRSIIGNTGVLLSKVIYMKQTKNKNFVIIDAAMNDLIRPALYDAKHRITPCNKSKSFIKKIHEFVGPICETSDKFLLTKKYQSLKQGEVLVIHDVGAYGMVLSSNYNLRPKAAEILIKGSKDIVIKKRQNIKDIV